MSLFGAAATSAAAANPTQGDISKDVALKDPPKDGVADLSFSPAADFLAVASWDNQVRIYEIDASGNSQGRASFEHAGPAVACGWSQDGTKVLGGGTDKAAFMLDLKAGGAQKQQVAAHDEPIKALKTFQSGGNDMLVTGSWDKTIKYWDLRQQAPAATVSMQGRVYTMDIKDKLLVVGCADRYINVVNLDQPDKVFKTMQSPLKWQTRVVSCFSDASGFAVGSVEGRCAIQYVEEKNAGYNFSFKCHRQPDPTQRDVSKVFAVNAISFHPEHGTFSTAGSDGTFHFWDKDAKHRLKGYPEVGGPISATAFNRTGSIFAYAVSYDWSKGYAHNNPSLPIKIMLHPVAGDECKPRPGAKKK